MLVLSDNFRLNPPPRVLSPTLARRCNVVVSGWYVWNAFRTDETELDDLMR